jgi:hypothetical protein
MTRVTGFLYLLAGVAPAAVAQVDQQRALEYFKEAQVLCERDGGRLWGVSICAPMVLADRRTQTITTSRPAPEGARPRLLGIVNAPVPWGGATWAAYIWDDVVNRTPRARRELFLHEMFHGVQPELGLRAPARATEHLDAADGRYWLRLEWRALARALGESGEPRHLAIRDALAFRQARRMIYPASVDDERAQEITEGLAAYTGTVLAAPSAAEAIASAVENLTVAETGESFVRTFAYASGPAYGLLLDTSSPGWTRRVRGTDDLATLLMGALAVQPASDPTAAAARYGGAEIRGFEAKREQERQGRLAELRQRFVDGPVLVIPGGGSGMSDSRGAVVIPGIGTVYFHTFRSSGDWGTLEAENGVLVASDGRIRRVPGPVRREDGSFAGDGWTFKAAPGWVVREGARRGDYEVVRQQPSGTTDGVPRQASTAALQARSSGRRLRTLPFLEEPGAVVSKLPTQEAVEGASGPRDLPAVRVAAAFAALDAKELGFGAGGTQRRGDSLALIDQDVVVACPVHRENRDIGARKGHRGDIAQLGVRPRAGVTHDRSQELVVHHVRHGHVVLAVEVDGDVDPAVRAGGIIAQRDHRREVAAGRHAE